MKPAAAPLYERALEKRAKRLAYRRMGPRALLALVSMLARAGYFATLAEVHSWPKRRQGEAYLWALGRVEGRHHEAPPRWMP